MDTQTRWENQRDVDCAEHNQPKCGSFPDCGCPECHAAHKETGDINLYCQTCKNEKCVSCKGSGYLDIITPSKPDSKDQMECLLCGGTGRIGESNKIKFIKEQKGRC